MTTITRSNLSVTERGVRVFLSAGLIAATLAGQGAIGTFAFAPLLAIYPGITGFIGWDPLLSLIGRDNRRRVGRQFAEPAARVG